MTGRDGLVRGARAAEKAGDLERARVLLEAALRLPGGPEDPSPAAILRWVGATHRAAGDTQAALDCFRASLTVAARAGDDGDVSHAWNWLGILHQDRGELDRADRYFERARRRAVRCGDRGLVAMVEQNLGINANIRGDVHAALDHYHHSLRAYRSLGDDRRIAQVLNDRGMAFTDLAMWPAAARAFDESAALCDRIGDLHTRVMVEVNRIELALARGDLETASRTCDQALVLAQRLGRERVLGEVYRWLGAVQGRLENADEAEHYLLHALDIAERLEVPLQAGEALSELAALYSARNRNQEALRALSRARRVFSGMKARRDLADIARRLRAMEATFMAIVRRWGESIESKDRYTAGHCRRVAEYGVRLAEAAEVDEETLTWFRMGAFLHDVGKISVPGSILNKPGKLTEAEHEIMRRHAEIGATIVERIEFPWDIAPMVRSHHERWDGTGYPDGLRGEAIPLSARILCVADVYDALTTTRSYRPAYSSDEALAIMRRDAGRGLDPDLFARFEALILERPEARAA